MSSGPDAPPGPARPRLLVPGLLDVVVLDDGTGFIELGSLADVAPSVPQQEDLGRRVLIPRPALSEVRGTSETSVRPDLDLTIHPQVRARLDRLRWVLADRDAGTLAGARGHDVLEIEGGIAGARWVPASGPARRYIAPDPALWSLILGEDAEDDRAARWAETGSLQDRIVAALSDGAVSLRDLELARWAAGLIQRDLDREEALLLEIEERAAQVRASATAVAEALDRASRAGEDTVQIPVYGEATRVTDPGFVVRTGPGITVDGPDIEVPEAVLWRVDDVEPWEPSAALAHRTATFEAWHARIQDTRRRGKRRELLVWGLIGLLLTAGVTAGLLGQLALGRAQPTVDTDTDAALTDTDPPSPAR